MHKELLLDKFLDIGEIITKIKKSELHLLNKYPEANWNDIIGLRNIISHAYFEIDHNIIYKTCLQDIPVLKETTEKILITLNETKD